MSALPVTAGACANAVAHDAIAAALAINDIKRVIEARTARVDDGGEMRRPKTVRFYGFQKRLVKRDDRPVALVISVRGAATSLSHLSTHPHLGVPACAR